MPTITISKTYQDGDPLLESDLDTIRNGVTNFLNTTKIDSDNIQDLGIATAKIANSAITTAKIADSNVTKAKIETSQQLPPGVIMAYPASTAPTGWLLCNGAAVSRTTYADLFAIIGDVHGSGDGSTTFNLPDYRGRFLRGVDGGTGRDPDAASRTAMNSGGNTGNNIGSIQDDAYPSHAHDQGTLSTDSQGDHTHFAAKNISDSVSGLTSSRAIVSDGGDYGLNGSDLTADIGLTSSNGAHTHSVSGNTGSSGSSTETRPKNAYTNFIIKT